VSGNKSLVFLAKGDYARALELAFSGLKILEQLNDTLSRPHVLETIGTIYMRQKKYEKTHAYYEQAADLYRRSGDRAGQARVLGNRGIVLNEQHEYIKALEYHQGAYKANQAAGKLASQQINLTNIGITFTHLRRYDEALSYYEKALELSRQLKKAIIYLEEAVVLCKAMNFTGPYLEFMRYLSDAQLQIANYEAALSTFKEYTAVHDSVFDQESRLRINAIEYQREQDIKNRDLRLRDQQLKIENLQLIKKRNERLLFVLSILLLATGLVLLYRLYRLRNIRHKKVLSDIATIQSHEVRAPLARILGLLALVDIRQLSEENRKMMEYLRKSADELDEVVKKTVKATNEQ
jgi:tetratricopeptide (TPR) repeat protein